MGLVELRDKKLSTIKTPIILSDIEVYSNEENDEIFDCYEIKVSFEPV